MLAIKYSPRDQIKEDMMGGTCGTYGEGRGAYRFVDRIILKWISKKQDWRAWTGFMAQDGKTGELS